MLESITINDFQVHEVTRVDFDPLATTIIGDSEAGKSSLLRALRWVSLNRPSGDAFLRIGSAGMRVALRADSRKVIRVKEKRANLYKLDGKEFRALGASVPDEVAAVLNVDEVNFHRQHDTPFWFGASAGQVSKALNEIVNLDAIDRSLDSVASALRKARNTAETSELRLSVAREQRETLAHIADLDDDLKQLEKLNARIEAVDVQASALRLLIAEDESLEERAQNAARVKAEAENVVSAGSQAVALSERAEALNKLIAEIADAEQRANNAQPDLGDLDTLKTEHERLEASVGVLGSILSDLDRLEEKLCESQREATELEQALERAQCPTCGGPLTPTVSGISTCHSPDHPPEQTKTGSARSRER